MFHFVVPIVALWLVFFSRSGMCLVVYLGQMLEIKVRIDLSRRDVRVAQKFLKSVGIEHMIGHDIPVPEPGVGACNTTSHATTA